MYIHIYRDTGGKNQGGKRVPLQRQKRPTTEAKETYYKDTGGKNQGGTPHHPLKRQQQSHAENAPSPVSVCV